MVVHIPSHWVKPPKESHKVNFDSTIEGEKSLDGVIIRDKKMEEYKAVGWRVFFKIH